MLRLRVNTGWRQRHACTFILPAASGMFSDDRRCYFAGQHFALASPVELAPRTSLQRRRPDEFPLLVAEPSAATDGMLILGLTALTGDPVHSFMEVAAAIDGRWLEGKASTRQVRTCIMGSVHASLYKLRHGWHCICWLAMDWLFVRLLSGAHVFLGRNHHDDTIGMTRFRGKTLCTYYRPV
jgi:hypothetical protein